MFPQYLIFSSGWIKSDFADTLIKNRLDYGSYLCCIEWIIKIVYSYSIFSHLAPISFKDNDWQVTLKDWRIAITVQPRLSWRLGSAPLASRAFTNLSRLSLLENISGVTLWRSAALTLAPFFRRASTVLVRSSSLSLEEAQAAIRGVKSSLWKLGLAPFSRRYSTTFHWPPEAAYISAVQPDLSTWSTGIRCRSKRTLSNRPFKAASRSSSRSTSALFGG